jgi:hypothetical protein
MYVCVDAQLNTHFLRQNKKASALSVKKMSKTGDRDGMKKKTKSVEREDRANNLL